jgi:hypothetical protein
MMKNKYNITCYADLEREEIRARKRIIKLETELHVRIKQLPEEVVKIGITKMITGIISGNAFQSAISIFQSVKSYFFDKEKETSAGKGFKDIIVDIFQGAIRKGFEK